MDSASGKLISFVQALGIPTLPEGQKTWIVRTKSGIYYEDFSLNGFVALGWDLIPLYWVNDPNRKREDAIEAIKDEYPDEKRPGLIYGQLVNFVRDMTPGDYVVIPSSGSNWVKIGIIGELYQEDVPEQPLFVDDYHHCPYRLRRRVRWVKELSAHDDVYLSKMLRAQQTISDISKHSSLIYRNLFDFYYLDGMLSLTLRKVTDDPVSFRDISKLQASIDNMIQQFTDILGEESIHEPELKIAISSPGFVQFVFTKALKLGTVLLSSHIFKSLGGKMQTADGQNLEGLPAYLQAFSNLANDRADRKVKYAEARKIDAEAERTKAEADKTRAEMRKTEAEANAQTIENMKNFMVLFSQANMPNTPEEMDEGMRRLQDVLSSAEANCERLEPIMERLGINPPNIDHNNIIPFPRNPNRIE